MQCPQRLSEKPFLAIHNSEQSMIIPVHWIIIIWQNINNSTLENCLSFISRNRFGPLYPKMLCAKFDWNWPIGCREYFRCVFNVFSLCCYYFHLEKVRKLSFEQTYIPKSLSFHKCLLWLWKTNIENEISLFLFNAILAILLLISIRRCKVL